MKNMGFNETHYTLNKGEIMTNTNEKSPAATKPARFSKANIKKTAKTVLPIAVGAGVVVLVVVKLKGKDKVQLTFDTPSVDVKTTPAKKA